MKKLSLYFANCDRPELFRIAFTHPLSGALRVSVRGKDSGAYLDTYTFQWTQAVKAFCVLALRSQEDLNFVLEGYKGSLASSLDYSIAKNTQWLSDVFGVESSGRTIAKKLFRRTNSDRNYSGPVGIALNPMLCQGLVVEVYLDQQKVDTSDYTRLASKIQDGQYVDLITVENSNLSVPDLGNYLTKIYETEFKDSICRTDIFTSHGLSSSLQAIKQAGFYRRIAGKDFQLFNDKISDQTRLGLSFDVNCAKSILEDLLIVGPSTLIGPVVIFNYLAQIKNYKFNFNFNYPHAVRLVRMMINNELESLPDLFFCGLAPAATLTASKIGKDYVPLMLMPDSSQKIVAHKSSIKNKLSLNNASYTFLKEEPSIPAFMLEELSGIGKFSKNKVKLMHHEPDESFALMHQGDPELRAAVFFPHYNFNCDFNNCVNLPDPRKQANSQEVILFVHKRKASNKKFMQTLESVIRDAWLDLKISPELIKSTLEKLLDHKQSYFKSVIRFGGLHNYRFD